MHISTYFFIFFTYFFIFSTYVGVEFGISGVQLGIFPSHKKGGSWFILNPKPRLVTRSPLSAVVRAGRLIYAYFQHIFTCLHIFFKYFFMFFHIFHIFVHISHISPNKGGVLEGGWEGGRALNYSKSHTSLDDWHFALKCSFMHTSNIFPLVFHTFLYIFTHISSYFAYISSYFPHISS